MAFHTVTSLCSHHHHPSPEKVSADTGAVWGPTLCKAREGWVLNKQPFKLLGEESCIKNKGGYFPLSSKRSFPTAFLAHVLSGSLPSQRILRQLRPRVLRRLEKVRAQTGRQSTMGKREASVHFPFLQACPGFS